MAVTETAPGVYDDLGTFEFGNVHNGEWWKCGATDADNLIRATQQATFMLNNRADVRKPSHVRDTRTGKVTRIESAQERIHRYHLAHIGPVEGLY